MLPAPMLNVLNQEILEENALLLTSEPPLDQNYVIEDETVVSVIEVSQTIKLLRDQNLGVLQILNDAPILLIELI